jgi:DNA-directed RNA polymerase omega subunit
MARVTVEDCIGDGKAIDKFDLVGIAVQCTRDIQSGVCVLDNPDLHKAHVLALKSIAAKEVNMDELRRRFVDSLNPSRYVDDDSGVDYVTPNDIAEEAFDDMDVMFDTTMSSTDFGDDFIFEDESEVDTNSADITRS